MKWSNILIGKKIGSGFTLVIMLVLILSVLNYLGLISIHDSSHEVLEISDLIHTLALREIDHLLWSERLRDIIDTGMISDTDIELDPHKCELGQWLNSDLRVHIEEIIPDAVSILQELTHHHSKMHLSAERVLGAVVANSNQAADIFREETQAYLEQTRSLLDKLADSLDYYRLETTDKMNTTIHSFIERSIFVPIIAVIFGVVMALIITLTITKPIKLLTTAMVDAAAGDLTVFVPYQSQDESGVMVRSFNQMVSNLKDVIGTSQQTVNRTVEASQSTSTATEELNASIEQVAASVTQLAASATEISVQTQKINEAAQETGELARTGSEKIESCMESMLLIEEASDETTAAINNLRVASKEIAKIVHVVTDIADQTNLLSLNAAIEAARAGEYGHGFAVVAEEVRKLAEQTKASLAEVNTLVNNLDTQMNSAVSSTNISREKVSQGTIVVKETTESLQEIVTQITSIMDQLRIIADKTQEQAATSQEIAAMTEQQAASTDGIASVTVELLHAAQQLEDIIKRLSV